MPETLSADDAAARLDATETLGVPLGTGQPPEFMAALGRRDDWLDLRIYGALMLAWSEAYNHENVHLLSGFWGPVERALRDQDANISFAPGRLPPLRPAARTAGTAGDGDGRHPARFGRVVQPLPPRRRDARRAAACGSRSRSGCSWSSARRSSRVPAASTTSNRHAIHVDEIDVLVESEAEPFALPAPDPGAADEAIAANATRFIPDGSTLQTGIGGIPSALVGRLAEGEGGGYGIHSEMFTDGLMRLHESGKVTNEKGIYDGVSVATFAGGSADLYAWLDGNDEVAFLPVDLVNSPDVIARNRTMVTINAAIAVDIHGQVVADTIQGRQYSGIGGHEDFVAGPALDLEDRSLLCLPSTVEIDGKAVSRIVPWFEAGTVVTTPRHQVDVIVTEHGAAELQGLTVHQRGEALAAVAHPDFRDELLEAAQRASKGRSPVA